MFWNAAATRLSGRRSRVSSPADPSGTVRARIWPSANSTGATMLTTSRPARASRSASAVGRSPSNGTASSTTSALLTASAFAAPSTLTLTLSHSWERGIEGASRPSTKPDAASAARVASREPMTTSWPAIARRSASPRPSGPVPPTIAIRVMRLLCRLRHARPVSSARRSAWSGRSKTGLSRTSSSPISAHSSSSSPIFAALPQMAAVSAMSALP